MGSSRTRSSVLGRRRGSLKYNADFDGFFGTVKSEMFYTRYWDGVLVAECIADLGSYRPPMKNGSRCHWKAKAGYPESLGLPR